MSSPEDRQKHARRLKRKVREKTKQKEIKDLKRIVEDKHGNKHDLSKMTHRDLVEAIQEDSLEE